LNQIGSEKENDVREGPGWAGGQGRLTPLSPPTASLPTRRQRLGVSIEKIIVLLRVVLTTQSRRRNLAVRSFCKTRIRLVEERALKNGHSILDAGCW
jgi:hypothetical protein